MQDDARTARELQIEAAAYALLAEKGYKATTMLAIAKRAKASNETLYKWYGNKQTLFLRMVERNARSARETLQDSLTRDAPLADVLDRLGPALLQLVTGERSVALNRAAVGDVHDTGSLGQTIARGGRNSIAPLLTRLIETEIARHGLSSGMTADAATDLYLDLLIGDLQIRRAIGVLDPPDAQTVAARAARAKQVLLAQIGAGSSGADTA